MKIVAWGELEAGKLSRETQEVLSAAMFAGAQVTLWLNVKERPETLDVFRKMRLDGIRFLVDEEQEIETFLNEVVPVLRKEHPKMVLLTDGIKNRQIAVRASARLNGVCIIDCVGIYEDSGNPILVKPIYSGNVLAHYHIDQFPCFTVLRNRSFPPLGTESWESATVQTEPVIQIIERSKSDWRITQSILPVTEKSIKNEAILVIGGRAVRNKADVSLINELAVCLGGQIGASRPLAMSGLVKMNTLIGQSGTVVAPKLAIVMGVSGMTPFTAGIENAERLIAINKDEHATIFASADYGIVGDYREIVDLLKEKLLKDKLLKEKI